MESETKVREGKPVAPKQDDGAAAAKGPKRIKRKLEDKVHTWPHLIRLEFLCILLVTIGLTIWSITINAPLEEMANPTKTPNPSKAPWYFLGLQEMLVYFDPWMAGVVLPSLIIVGLMLIPYIDINPKGNGYYTFKERKFAVLTYFFGFHVLWIALIIVGVFFRGPGWYLFWPWQKWDTHKVVALTNVDMPYWGPFKFLGNPKIFGVELIGLVVLAAFYGLAVLFYLWRAKKSLVLQQLGVVRYGIVAFLFMTMMLLPLKMILRLAFNIKYLWITPWFNI
ncbi:MAG: cytochrome C [Nitrospinae bacterium]|nr:cytochrome C [Nitrospinota bacterium]